MLGDWLKYLTTGSAESACPPVGSRLGQTGLAPVLTRLVVSGPTVLTIVWIAFAPRYLKAREIDEEELMKAMMPRKKKWNKKRD